MLLLTDCVGREPRSIVYEYHRAYLAPRQFGLGYQWCGTIEAVHLIREIKMLVVLSPVDFSKLHL